MSPHLTDLGLTKNKKHEALPKKKNEALPQKQNIMELWKKIMKQILCNFLDFYVFFFEFGVPPTWRTRPLDGPRAHKKQKNKSWCSAKKKTKQHEVLQKKTKKSLSSAKQKNNHWALPQKKISWSSAKKTKKMKLCKQTKKKSLSSGKKKIIIELCHTKNKIMELRAAAGKG